MAGNRHRTWAQLDEEIKAHCAVEAELSRKLEQTTKRLEACKVTLREIRDTSIDPASNVQATDCLKSLASIRVRDRRK